jgi:sphingomyelin phosphodiesterase 4
VVELWLTYIQPWRYTDPTKHSTENKSSLTSSSTRWFQYIMEHFPFYSSLFLIFLERSFQFDLMSKMGINLLFRVSKVRLPSFCI